MVEALTHPAYGLDRFWKRLLLEPRTDAQYENAATIALNPWREGQTWRAIYAAIGKISSLTGGGPSTSSRSAQDAPKGNIFNRFISMISAIFTPLLWALAGTGLWIRCS